LTRAAGGNTIQATLFFAREDFIAGEGPLNRSELP